MSIAPNYRKEGYAQVSQDQTSGLDDGHSLQLQESLVGIPSNRSNGGTSTIPVATSTPMMEVVAPATLPEGYEFEASLGSGQTIKVVVPAGGVEQGQKFSVPIGDKLGTMMTGSVSIPVGHWRDELFDCFKPGICHAHWWTSCVCTLLAAAQVIHRLKFTWWGSPATTPAQAAGAFHLLFYIVVGYFAIHIGLHVILVMMEAIYLPEPDEYMSQEEFELLAEQSLPSSFFMLLSLYRTMYWIYIGFIAVILTNLRRNVRAKYGIPAPDFEDACCSCFCHCCVAAQMLRHTTDYDVYPGKLCTATGLPPHAPSIV